MTDVNLLPRIADVERIELDRLIAYLRDLDEAGWVEQSYCFDWAVYQAVSHLASGLRITKMRLNHWVNSGPEVSREQMEAVWELFDSLRPADVGSEFQKATGEYLVALRALPDEAGLLEVDGFRGVRPLWVYQLGRLHELAVHSWDIFIARDRTARLPAAAVELFAGQLHNLFTAGDIERGRELTEGRRVELRTANPDFRYQLNSTGVRLRLEPAGSEAADLIVEGPAEEVCRLTAGRHFLPGSLRQLTVISGPPGDLGKLCRVFH